MTSSGSAPPREALSSPSISSRLTRSTSLHQSQADNRTPTPSAGRRRQNSHLTSSLFQTPIANMALALSNLPPDYPGLPCKAGESYSAQWPISDLQALKEHVEGDVDTAWGSGSESMPEALQRGLIIGRGWFKLDLGESCFLKALHLIRQAAQRPLYQARQSMEMKKPVLCRVDMQVFPCTSPQLLWTARSTKSPIQLPYSWESNRCKLQLDHGTPRPGTSGRQSWITSSALMPSFAKSSCQSCLVLQPIQSS